MTLGLCRTDDVFYRSIVHEKFGHVPPDDQEALRSLHRRTSLLQEFLRELDSHGVTAGWRANAAQFLAVCKAHGEAYAYHHQRLVKPYLESPAKAAPSAHTDGLTSSGPPLDEVIAVLQRLTDLRTARGVGSAAASIARLREVIATPVA